MKDLSSLLVLNPHSPSLSHTHARSHGSSIHHSNHYRHDFKLQKQAVFSVGRTRRTASSGKVTWCYAKAVVIRGREGGKIIHFTQTVHTHIFEKPGKAIRIVLSSFSPFFNSYTEGGIRAVWDLVLSASALCSSDAAQSYSNGWTGASICSSIYPSCRGDSVFTDGTKRGRREGAGCLERRRALSSSHRKKSLLWSLEHNKALLPCTFGPGQRIIPIMQHVWLPESPMARLIPLEGDRARDVIQYTPNPWHTHYFFALFSVALEPGFPCQSQLTLYTKNALQL